jgi:hypothetical protein
MTFIARYSLVSALQGELGSLVMIERRGLPFLFGMARGARARASVPGKLTIVRVLVTALAQLRCSLELDLRLPGRRFVACSTRNGAVAATEREGCFGVIEAVHIRPRASAMAGLAAKDGSVGPAALHSSFEFPMMRIDVTRRTRAIGKLEGKNIVAPAGNSDLVALRARNGRVPASQRKV